MSRMIEPLKQEPEEIPFAAEDAYPQGFHDGAYALANELLQLQATGGSIEAALAAYEQRDARPCKDWTHEPKQH